MAYLFSNICAKITEDKYERRDETSGLTSKDYEWV